MKLAALKRQGNISWLERLVSKKKKRQGVIKNASGATRVGLFLHGNANSMIGSRY